MSSTNSIFTGASRYAGDFQKIIDRAVAIASLPKAQLESQKTALGGQSAALSALDTKFSSLLTAIQSLESAAGDGSYWSSVSDNTVLTASVAGGALEGAYSIEVIDAGSYTSAMSKNGLMTVADPFTQSISSADEFTLTGVEDPIQPAAHTLSALADAINAAPGADVRATIVNVGSTSSPDYRLSLESTKLGGAAIAINDGSQELLDTLSTGTPATYRVNGQPSTPISSDSRSVTVAPGLTVTFLKAGSASVTVARNSTAASNALSSFVTAYNAAAEELDLHRGEGTGALRGNSIVHTLSRYLRELAGYASGTDGISSLTSLGLSFDKDGKLSLDSAAFSSATSGQFTALTSFLGDSQSGGFLQFATGLMDSLEGATDGVIKTALSGVQDQMTDQDSRIAGEQDRIDHLEEGLRAQMSAADALIASLEQRVNYINSLFESMRVARESMR